MRYFYVIPILFLSISCSKRENGVNPDLIEGEWTTGKYPYDHLIFENGKYYDPIEVEKHFTYQIENDILIIDNEESGRKTYRIVKLTEDSLTLKPVERINLTEDSGYKISGEKDGVYRKLTPQELFEKYLNSVKGHIERDTIIGNFTGLGIDTIYICEEVDLSHLKEKGEDPNFLSYDYLLDYQHYYARSNNPEIPDVEIFGMPYTSPQLVYEGDLDGDGRDEWGSLPVWMNSQWRTYRVYNYDSKKKEWRHLYYDLPDTTSTTRLLSTPEYVRESGYDLVEKGPEPGLIKIHYGEYDGIVYDTILKPNYVPITVDTY